MHNSGELWRRNGVEMEWDGKRATLARSPFFRAAHGTQQSKQLQTWSMLRLAMMLLMARQWSPRFFSEDMKFKEHSAVCVRGTVVVKGSGTIGAGKVNVHIFGSKLYNTFDGDDSMIMTMTIACPPASWCSTCSQVRNFHVTFTTIRFEVRTRRKENELNGFRGKPTPERRSSAMAHMFANFHFEFSTTGIFLSAKG